MARLNIILVVASIASLLVSCKKKEVDVNTDFPEVNSRSEVSIFRPKMIFTSTDSVNFRLVFEYEYDEMGRVKTRHYYYDSFSNDLNSIQKIETSYSNQLVLTKTFSFNKLLQKYVQSGWDSVFYDNSNRITKRRGFNSYQSTLQSDINTIGANARFDYDYSTIGDSLVITKSGIELGNQSTIINYYDKQNIAVKTTFPGSHVVTNQYTLEKNGIFLDSYILNYSTAECLRLVSYFKFTADYFPNSIISGISKLDWTFDSSGRPIKLSLTENTNGSISNSFYRYEY